MRIDLNTYAINRPFIQKWYKDNRRRSISDAIAIMSSATHCPSICMCFYLAESEGFTPEIMKIIDGLIAFYGYTKILNQSPESPYKDMI